MDSIPVGSRLIASYLPDMTSGMEAPFDIEKAHRWFAIEANNGTWDLLEKADRTREDDRNLVHIAHTSAFHWVKVGNETNVARAACMVANAHAAVGDGHAALRHGKHCVELTEAHPDKMTDWDLAFAYDALARATKVAGETKKAADLKTKARELGDAIADPGDKSIFDGWFSNR